MSTARLHPRLQADLEILKAVDAGVLLAGGALSLLLPALVLRLLGLSDAALTPVRSVGLLWVVTGLAVALGLRRPWPRRAVTALVVVLAANALLLLVGPFLLPRPVGAFGWILLCLLALTLATTATAWFFIHDRLRGLGT